MKKIGILTFHKSINYGSVLQAWALEKILQKQNYNVSIIDYEPSVYKKQYGLLELSNGWKSNINRLPNYFARKSQAENFAKFRKSYLHLQDSCTK